jgi:hypothetical protein
LPKNNQALACRGAARRIPPIILEISAVVV